MAEQTYFRPGVGLAVKKGLGLGAYWEGRLEFSAGELRALADIVEASDYRDMAVPELRALCDLVNELNGQ